MVPGRVEDIRDRSLTFQYQEKEGSHDANRTQTIYRYISHHKLPHRRTWEVSTEGKKEGKVAKVKEGSALYVAAEERDREIKEG